MTGKHFAFAVMATIWGLTWIAIKTGVEALPPFLFASTRLLAAGTFLLLLARLRGAMLSMSGSHGRVVAAAILVNTVAYGSLFWGGCRVLPQSSVGGCRITRSCARV